MDLDLRDFSFRVNNVFRSVASVKAMQGWIKAPKDFKGSCIWMNIFKTPHKKEIFFEDSLSKCKKIYRYFSSSHLLKKFLKENLILLDIENN